MATAFSFSRPSGVTHRVWFAEAPARMNVVDIGILVVIGLFAVGGLRRGFLLGFIDLITLGLAIIVAARSTDALAAPLRDCGLPEPLASSIGFIFALVISLAVIGLANKVLLSPLQAFGAGTPLGWVNSVLGLVPGTIRGLAVAALLLMVLMAIPAEPGFRVPIAASRLAMPIMESGREALTAGLTWAGIDPRGLSGFTRPWTTS